MIEGCAGLLIIGVPASGMLPQNLSTAITKSYYTIQALSAARESLSEEAFQAAWTEGSRTPLEQVMLTP